MNVLWNVIKFSPYALVFGIPVVIVVTYVMAISNLHVAPLFPYVSDVSANPPESCVFTLFLSLFSYFIFFTTYVRYREVEELLKLNPSVKVKPFWNKVSFLISCLTCLGLNIVDSFQEINVFSIHVIGSVLCFFCGTIYFTFQTRFTARLFPEEKFLFYMRLALTALNAVFLFGTFAPVYFALEEFEGENVLMWQESDGGYSLHLLSTFCEWFLVTCFVLYLGTFLWDFMKFEVEPPAIIFKELPRFIVTVKPDAPTNGTGPTTPTPPPGPTTPRLPRTA